MKKQMNCSNDYIIIVASWTERFSELMRRYSNAATAILAYYLHGSTKLIVCPEDMEEFRLHGEAMRCNGVMLAAAEASGMLAEAIPELFRIALESYGNWCVMRKDVLYLLQHHNLCRYIPFECRFVAETVASMNAMLIDDEFFWQNCVSEAKAKLAERKAGTN